MLESTAFQNRCNHFLPFKISNRNNLNKLMLSDNEVNKQWNRIIAQEAQIFKSEVLTKQIIIEDKVMKFQYFFRGSRPPQGYSLIFGLHGGGGCPTSINDQQFTNHLHLYDKYLPDGVIWFVPRSCEQAPDMWWKAYLQDFFGTIIKAFVVNRVVDPNRVYMTGYSAGGDGVYHLAPMFADWWAGAAMMAGHPNGVQLYNVRNINFSIQVGGLDSAYNRNQLARQYINTLQALKAQYGGFTCEFNQIQQCQGHWMKLKECSMFSKFFSTPRNPYPERILFKQHPRIKKRFFYNLQVDPNRHKQLLIINRLGNIFYINGPFINIVIYINPYIVDFNQNVQVYYNNTHNASKWPEKNIKVLRKSIAERMDPAYIFWDQIICGPNSKSGSNNPIEFNPKQQLHTESQLINFGQISQTRDSNFEEQCQLM